jgi:hypothetical protein
MPSSYQVVLWKQESFVVLRPLQIEFFRNLPESHTDSEREKHTEGQPFAGFVAVSLPHLREICSRGRKPREKSYHCG